MCARAQANTALAHLLDVFQYRVAMARLCRQAKQDEQNRFREIGVGGLHDASHCDMSYDDIITCSGWPQVRDS